MARILMVALAALVRASARRIARGPASPGWSARLEMLVAVQREVLTFLKDWPPARVRALRLGRSGAASKALAIDDETLGGVRCERSRRPGSTTGRHLVYIHGGGFAVGSPASHRELVSTIVSHADVVAHSIDYRQPPEHRFPAAVDDVVAAYRALLESGVAPEQVAIAGDSAGGNLCLALMLRAKAEGLPQPASATLICPAPDLALTGKSWEREPYLDYLTKPIAQAWLDHYIDRADVGDPYASPLRGDLRGLPPILMHAGAVEGLLDEIEALATKLREADVPLTYRVTPEMPHVWHLFAGALPEADASLREIAAFVQTTTRDPERTDGGDPTDR
jgi:acetyl esterase/lipase